MNILHQIQYQTHISVDYGKPSTFQTIWFLPYLTQVETNRYQPLCYFEHTGNNENKNVINSIVSN